MTGNDHIDPEVLLLLLDDELEGEERATVEAHLEECDPCVRELQALQRRVALLDDPTDEVPIHLINSEVEPTPAPSPTIPRWAPIAIAALALLVVVWRIPFGGTPDDQRAIEMRTAVRIHAEQVDVHTAPAPDAPVVTQLEHGDRIEVTEKTDAWYRILLPNGQTGWVPTRAVRDR